MNETNTTAEDQSAPSSDFSNENASSTQDVSSADEQPSVEADPSVAVGPKEPSLEELLSAAKAQATEYYDKYLRLNAEFENFKKRMARENADKLKYYHLGFVKELLPAVDSLESAIHHAQKEAKLDGLLEGIQMVDKIVQDVFGKFGVNKVKADGAVFDPNCHQAVGMVASDTVPENHIVDVFQPGYFLHDRIVRPAMVRIAKKS